MTGPGFLAEYGPRLLARGYDIVPIKRGHKFPKGLSNWQKGGAGETQLRAWLANGFSDGGVGILAARTPGFDIDVRDQEIRDKLVAWCEENIGPTVQRVGDAPKVLLVYRTDKPFGKMLSAKYRCELGFEHKVEILGAGNQFVAYAIHPDTGKPYDWPTPQGAADVDADDLLAVDEDQARAFLDYFESIVPDNWILVEPGGRERAALVDTPEEDRTLATIKPKVDLTEEQLQRALDALDPDMAMSDWVRVGMGLWHQFDGSDEGFNLWDAWSSQGSKYQEREMRNRWRSFDSQRFRNPVTAATILKLAKDAGVHVAVGGGVGTELAEFLRRYVFIEDGNRVCDLDKPPHVSISRLDEFRNATANIRHEVPAPTEKEPDRVKVIPVHQSWITHADRKTSRGVRYDPGKPMFYQSEQDGGLWWVNDFHMPRFGPSNASTAVFHEHMDYLFPNEPEREWFVDWIAFNLQFPERRCKVTPLHVSRAHGTGRGWVVELLSKLLGPWNCTKTKMGVLSGEGSGGAFQNYLDRSLFCAVEEVREGSRRYSVSDRIRDLLTENYLEVNVKYGTSQTQQVFTNFFFMTNHTDALVLTAEDRRVNVFQGPDKPRAPEYYTRLYDWLEGPGVAALFHELMARDLSRFNWQRSMSTPARDRMIEGNRTVTEQLFHELMAAPPRPAMSFRAIVEHMTELSGEDAFDAEIDERQVVKLLQQYAEQMPRQMRLGGRGSRRVRPWILDPEIRDDSAAIRAAVSEEKEA